MTMQKTCHWDAANSVCEAVCREDDTVWGRSEDGNPFEAYIVAITSTTATLAHINPAASTATQNSVPLGQVYVSMSSDVSCEQLGSGGFEKCEVEEAGEDLIIVDTAGAVEPNEVVVAGYTNIRAGQTSKLRVEARDANGVLLTETSELDFRANIFAYDANELECKAPTTLCTMTEGECVAASTLTQASITAVVQDDVDNNVHVTFDEPESAIQEGMQVTIPGMNGPAITVESTSDGGRAIELSAKRTIASGSILTFSIPACAKTDPVAAVMPTCTARPTQEDCEAQEAQETSQCVGAVDATGVACTSDPTSGTHL
eukprot:SAG31_NODE_1_length_62978_cov_30.836130_21_plen_316_part_00